MTTRLERLLGAPLLHCLLLGGALAWGIGFVAPPVLEPDPAAVADAVRTWRESVGRAPGRAELTLLVDEIVDDEVLYRAALARRYDELPVVRDRLVKLATFLELLPASASSDERLRAARAMGLDRSDRLVRRYMVGAVRERLAAEAAGARPTRAEIEAHHRVNAASYRQPATLRFRHVYIGGLGEESLVRAQALARDLQEFGAEVSAAIRAGDAFQAGHDVPLLDAARIERRFGEGFAQAVFALELRTWSEPIRSAYGYHLVWKDEERPARQLPIEAVESQIEIELARRRDEVALSEAIAALRARYRVVVPDAAR